jgi:hypothetical protein
LPEKPDDLYPTDYFPSFPTVKGSGEAKALHDYLESVYNFAYRTTLKQIDWYNKSKNPKRVNAQRLRGGAILFIALGGLTPFLTASGILPKDWNGFDWTQIGYIFLGIAVCLIALDRYFGHSSSWMRYMIASNNLQKYLAEFQYEWAILSAKVSWNELTPAGCEPLLKSVQTFALKVHSEIEKETSEWIAEYRSNLAEMERSARQQIEAMNPGSISLKIEDAKNTKDGVSIFIDNKLIAQGIKQPYYLISQVFPGPHSIEIRGDIDGKTVTTSNNVQMAAGKTVDLVLKFDASKD